LKYAETIPLQGGEFASPQKVTRKGN